MIIDCSKCEKRESEDCEDCLVKVVLSHGKGPLILDSQEEKAIDLLQEAGLLPRLKYKKKAG